MRRPRQRPPSNALLPALALTVTTSLLRSSSTSTLLLPGATAFCVLPDAQALRKTGTVTSPLYSSVGGGGKDPPPEDGNGGSSSEWDDFLNPNKEESENLFRAREFMSENSLPISHGLEEGIEEDLFAKDKDENSSAIVGPNVFVVGGLTPDLLARNPYINVVSKLSPSELISKFTATAHPRVQNAVRSTILGLIGGLPKMAFETTTITTGQKLASLMFQLQMTGYMFKVGQYALRLHSTLDYYFLQNFDHSLTKIFIFIKRMLSTVSPFNKAWAWRMTNLLATNCF